MHICTFHSRGRRDMVGTEVDKVSRGTAEDWSFSHSLIVCASDPCVSVVLCYRALLAWAGTPVMWYGKWIHWS